MNVITKEEFTQNKDRYTRLILDGAVFIHPTDTIYGIGCDARNEQAAQKIRALKQRPDLPFSVIAPSRKWLYDNCELSADAVKWVEKLPGPYTLVLKLANDRAVAASVHPAVDTLGVRIPANWFAEFVEQLGIPVVSTSANITGEQFMTDVDNLDENIKKNVDFIIYEGEKKGKPSTVVKLFEERLEVIER